jgi:hypothetical protein
VKTVTEHERIARMLEGIREQLREEIREQQDASIYHAQHAAELERIARRMTYSRDQQVLFRISRDCARLAVQNQSAAARRRSQGNAWTRELKRTLAKRNAANGSTSAA